MQRAHASSALRVFSRVVASRCRQAPEAPLALGQHGGLRHLGCPKWSPRLLLQQRPFSRARRAHSAAPGTVSPVAALQLLDLPTKCPGCGVKLQGDDQNQPGFFQMPKKAMPDDPAKVAADLAADADAAAAESAEAGEASPESFEGFNFLGEDSPAVKPAPDLLKPQIVCARCYALQHYGRVKNQQAEALLPSFDFEKVVGSRLRKASLRARPVVLLLVDLADFDGSFPAAAAKMLGDPELDGTYVVLGATKTDLLPKTASPIRLEQWVRKRAKAGGLENIDKVKFLGSPNGFGVSILAQTLEELSRQRSGAEIWVIGSQNAGKSSLINALSDFYYGADPPVRGLFLISTNKVKVGPVASHLPGTTLDLVRLEELLPGRRTVIDTPGLLQPHQITPRLNADEARLVLPRRPLRPRTFRVGVGATVSIGGLARVDVLEGSPTTIYLTVWVSEDVPTHLGKTVNAEELYAKHIGAALKPPVGPERAAELGSWAGRSVTVEGTSWTASTVDLAVAGLGWVGVGLDGAANLRVWTYEGVGVTVRDALIPDYAKELETPGFDFEKAGKTKGGRTTVRAPRKR